MSFELTARRLLIVSGKGGVGKSTVAAALGVAAARRGLRTVVVEVAGRRDIVGLLGAKARQGHREVEVYPGLRHVAIDRQPALEEYLRDEVPGRLPAAILARSRAFELFMDATPGMGELLTIGKVWELSQRPRHRRGAPQYDLVVLDGPSSGQLVGLLQAPRTFSSIARVGPVARQGAAIERMLLDSGLTAVVAVATAEQMAVSETLAPAGGAARASSGSNSARSWSTGCSHHPSPAATLPRCLRQQMTQRSARRTGFTVVRRRRGPSLPGWRAARSA